MEIYLNEFETKLKSIATNLRVELQSVRSGRPSPQLVENIQVDYNGQMLPIKQLGSIGLKPPREIDITVWDKAIIETVAKAIEAAKTGLSTSVDGTTIRCFLPPLSEERRKEMMKLVKKTSEGTRIQVRNARDYINKQVKVAESRKEFSEDQMFKAKDTIQKIVDKSNKEVEALVEAKSKELEE